MRHKVDGRKFDRNTGARKALFRNLLTQFFKHDRIVTTEAKAKEVRRIAEKLITKAKKEDLHARRQVLRVVTDKTAVKRLFDIILAKLSDRNTGGYTRIIKIGNRKGDDAPMALLEIIEPGTGKTKTRKGSKKKALHKTKSKPKKEKVQEKAAVSKKTIPEKKEAVVEKPVELDTVVEEMPGEEPAPETSADTASKETEKKETEEIAAKEEKTKEESPSSDEKGSQTEAETKSPEDNEETQATEDNKEKQSAEEDNK